MNNPGVYLLGSLQITAPRAIAILTPITGLAGMKGVSLEATLAYGGGGTGVMAIVATSFDSGATWRHVARFDFATASRVAWCNLNGLASKGVSSYADLNAEGVNDGPLADQLALLVSSTGTYLNPTQLSVRASVR